MGLRFAKPEKISALIERDSPGLGNGRSFIDTYRRWLASHSATGNSIHELERSFLSANGATGATYSELLGSYLHAAGYSTGSLKDRYRGWLAAGSVDGSDSTGQPIGLLLALTYA